MSEHSRPTGTETPPHTRTSPTPRRHTAPPQPGRHPVTTPSCCGRSMARDGSQYVCRKCGSWTDPGTTGGGQ